MQQKSNVLSNEEKQAFRLGIFMALATPFDGAIRAFARRLAEQHEQRQPFDDWKRIEKRISRMAREEPPPITLSWERSQAYNVVTRIERTTDDEMAFIAVPARVQPTQRNSTNAIDRARRQVEVLAFLTAHPEPMESIAELRRLITEAYGAHHTPITMTGDIRHLSKHGFVRSRPTEVQGHRRKIISLTESGKKYLASHRGANNGVPLPPGPEEVCLRTPSTDSNTETTTDVEYGMSSITDRRKIVLSAVTKLSQDERARVPLMGFCERVATEARETLGNEQVTARQIWGDLHWLVEQGHIKFIERCAGKRAHRIVMPTDVGDPTKPQEFAKSQGGRPPHYPLELITKAINELGDGGQRMADIAATMSMQMNRPVTTEHVRRSIHSYANNGLLVLSRLNDKGCRSHLLASIPDVQLASVPTSELRPDHEAETDNPTEEPALASPESPASTEVVQPSAPVHADISQMRQRINERLEAIQKERRTLDEQYARLCEDLKRLDAMSAEIAEIARVIRGS
ncbi:MAG: hypothetical protein ABIG71_02200 [Candidatus Uhrbacteria bacterium]